MVTVMSQLIACQNVKFGPCSSDALDYAFSWFALLLMDPEKVPAFIAADYDRL